MTYQIYSDGASRGNPGPSGIGAVIYKDGEVVHEIAEYLGVTTNNVAEYRALLAALDYCVKKKLEPIEIFADSQLMIRQLQGMYKVKHPSIIPLHQKAKDYLKFIKCDGYTHVPRERNKHADKLSNLGIDQHREGL